MEHRYKPFVKDSVKTASYDFILMSCFAVEDVAFLGTF